jgi:hypothetical protein
MERRSSSRRLHIARLTRLLLLLCLSLAFQSDASSQIRKATRSSQVTTPVANIRQVDFRNFTYRVAGFSEQSSDVHLRKGSYEQREGGLVTYSVKLYKLAFGDLTGDGSEEAAVVLMTSGGGTGYMTEGFVYKLQNGRPVVLSQLEGGIGDRYDSVESVKITNGLLNVERTSAGQDDSIYVYTIRYRWNGRALVEGGRSKPRKQT